MAQNNQGMITLEKPSFGGGRTLFYDPKTEEFSGTIIGPGGSSTFNYKKGDANWKTYWDQYGTKITQKLNGTTGKIVIGAPTSAGPLPNAFEGQATLQYPLEGNILYREDNDVDYVMFQFGKYIPPFSSESATIGNNLAAANTNTNDNVYQAYNASNNIRPEKVTVKSPNAATGFKNNVMSAILPMPQDLSTESRQSWEAKSFTAIGRGIIMAANGNFGNTAFQSDKNFDVLEAASNAIKTSVLNKIPGVGGNLTLNDLTGSTKGIIINPNAEMLYEAPSLREVGMSFKMVPRNEKEAEEIALICNYFRKCSLPRWGKGEGIDAPNALNEIDKTVAGENFIQVPFLCKFTFMKGKDVHPYLNQYKPCALTSVEVNYTPDGTYATYDNGAPIATQLTLKFSETKLIYQNEIDYGY